MGNLVRGAAKVSKIDCLRKLPAKLTPACNEGDVKKGEGLSRHGHVGDVLTADCL